MTKRKPGRPTKYDVKMIRKMARLPIELVLYFEQVGNGNFSEGVRVVAERDRQAQKLETP